MFGRSEPAPAVSLTSSCGLFDQCTNRSQSDPSFFGHAARIGRPLAERRVRVSASSRRTRRPAPRRPGPARSRRRGPASIDRAHRLASVRRRWPRAARPRRVVGGRRVAARGRRGVRGACCRDAAEHDRRLRVGLAVSRAVDRDGDLVAVPRPPLVDVAVARGVALAPDGCAGRPVFGSGASSGRSSPTCRCGAGPSASYSRLNELAALVVLDGVHDARVVVTELAPAHGAGRVEVLVQVRFAVVVQVADAADLVARALVVHAADVGLAVAVRVERVDAVARLGAVLVLQRLGARRLRRLRRRGAGTPAASHRPRGSNGDGASREPRPRDRDRGNVQARLVHRLAADVAQSDRTARRRQYARRDHGARKMPARFTNSGERLSAPGASIRGARPVRRIRQRSTPLALEGAHMFT